MESVYLGECSITVIEHYMCIQNCIKAGVSFIPSLLEANDTPETLGQNKIFQQVASVLYLFHQQGKSGKRSPYPHVNLECWSLGLWEILQSSFFLGSNTCSFFPTDSIPT